MKRGIYKIYKMKMRILIAALSTIFPSFTASAERINVVATFPYIGSIVMEIAKDKAKVVSLSDGKWDPHSVPPKPSFVVKLRDADLLIINGGQLEIGWLPPLIERAGNPKILPGENGFLELSTLFPLIQKPTVVSRAQGDVHPEGNPHFYLDPEKIPKIAKAIAEKLCSLDPGNCEFYNDNLKSFEERWQAKLDEWSGRMERLKGISIFTYHRLFDYFFLRYDIKVEETLEPFAGIPPTTSHLIKLAELAKKLKISFIAYGIYNPKGPVDFLSKRTGIKQVLLPHDVGVEGIKDIWSLFDEIIRRLENL